MFKLIIAGSLMIAAPAFAQSSVGGGRGGASAASAQATAVQPAAGGQVGQPPRNSAMRQAETGGAAQQVPASVGSTPTNAMTLTLSAGSGMQSRSQGGTPQGNQVGMSGGDAAGRQSSGSPQAGNETGSDAQQGGFYDAAGIMHPGGGSQP